MKLFNLIIAFFLVAGVSQAATLAELQEQALNSRNLIKKYQANLEISRRDQALARSSLYPALDLSYTVNALDEDSAVENSENSVAKGVISWNLFAGFADHYKIKSARLARQAEEFKLQGLRQDIRLNVALLYLGVYSRQASLQVAQDAWATLDRVHADAQNSFKVGLIKKNELLRFKLDLDHAAIVLKKARAELDKGVRLLEREVDGKLELAELSFGEFVQLPSLQADSGYEARMLARRSELKALQELAEAARAQTRAAYGGIYPKVDLSGSYRRYNDDYGIDGDNPDEELRTQLTLSINLFDGFAKQARVGKARRLADALGYDLAELESELKMQLKNLLLDYEVSAENVAVAQGSIEQAEENLRISRLAYKEGLEKESDLLDAITNLSRARSNQVAARGELFADYFKIDRAVEGL